MAVARDDDASDDSSKELDSPKTRAAKELQARMARLTEEQEAKRREAKMSEPSGLLRSERMCMVQLIVQHDAAQHTVEELGALGSLMFIDLNEGVTAFRRTFLPELRRCDEADRALRFIGDQLAAVGSSPPRASWRSELRVSLPELVSELEDAVKEVRQLQASQRELASNYNALIELSHVLRKCDGIFSEARQGEFGDGGVQQVHARPARASAHRSLRSPPLQPALSPTRPRRRPAAGAPLALVRRADPRALARPLARLVRQPRLLQLQLGDERRRAARRLPRPSAPPRTRSS